jgi:hypothetical protein
MAYGDLYNQAKSAWDSTPLDQRLSGLGYTQNEEGQWWSPDKQQYGNTENQYFANAAPFDSKKWFNDQGIIALNPQLMGDYGDTGGVTLGQDFARQYQDNQARSFNQFGFNFQNYDDMLRHTTGDGGWVDDPTLGKLWVPQNRDSQTWNQDYMGASSRQGSAG